MKKKRFDWIEDIKKRWEKATLQVSIMKKVKIVKTWTEEQLEEPQTKGRVRVNCPKCGPLEIMEYIFPACPKCRGIVKFAKGQMGRVTGEVKEPDPGPQIGTEKTDRRRTPEERLMLSLLTLMVKDFMAPLERRKNKNLTDKARQAEIYFFETKKEGLEGYVFSFDSICRYFGFSAKLIRKELAKMRLEGIVKGIIDKSFERTVERIFYDRGQ